MLLMMKEYLLKKLLPSLLVLHFYYWWKIASLQEQNTIKFKLKSKIAISCCCIVFSFLIAFWKKICFSKRETKKVRFQRKSPTIFSPSTATPANDLLHFLQTQFFFVVNNLAIWFYVKALSHISSRLEWEERKTYLGRLLTMAKDLWFCSFRSDCEIDFSFWVVLIPKKIVLKIQKDMNSRTEWHVIKCPFKVKQDLESNDDKLLGECREMMGKSISSMWGKFFVANVQNKAKVDITDTCFP